MGLQRKRALGFKLRRSSHKGRGPRSSEGKGEDHEVLKESREDHVVLEFFFLPRGLGNRRDFARKKRGGRTHAGGP